MSTSASACETAIIGKHRDNKVSFVLFIYFASDYAGIYMAFYLHVFDQLEI